LHGINGKSADGIDRQLFHLGVVHKCFLRSITILN
jgi:hypothetical protein